jgi:hypothetical protein
MLGFGLPLWPALWPHLNHEGRGQGHDGICLWKPALLCPAQTGCIRDKEEDKQCLIGDKGHLS